MENQDEKISVAELRIYKGNEDNKDLFLTLSKIFIVRNKKTAFDVLGFDEYPVYEMHNDVFYPATEMTNSNLNPGDIFCVVEKDLDIKTNIFDYMIESDDFFYQRLPYLQERFSLFSKDNISSYVLPLLKQYERKIRKDSKQLLCFKTLLTDERQNLIKKNYNKTYKIK